MGNLTNPDKGVKLAQLATFKQLLDEHGMGGDVVEYETSNIQQLTQEQCAALKVGDIVNKVTGNQKHSYHVSYKDSSVGMYLTYTDAENIETVSYDNEEGTWVYNSTDITAISGKADKTATVSTVTYDTSNKKLTKTINGATSDVVSVSTLKTDLELSKSDVGLGNVGNFKAVSTEASQGLTDTEKGNARTNIGAGTYSKPSGGIPKTDLAEAVQTSLGKADTAIQDVSDKADKSTTVTNVAYDTTNKKITKTINGSTTDVVTASTVVSDGISSVSGYTTCSTASSTSAKTAALTGFKLVVGAKVSVKFSENVLEGASLNINSTGAKVIIFLDVAIKTGVIYAGDVATFIYDGTYYNLISVANSRNIYYASPHNNTWIVNGSEINLDINHFIPKIGDEIVFNMGQKEGTGAITLVINNESFTVTGPTGNSVYVKDIPLGTTKLVLTSTTSARFESVAFKGATSSAAGNGGLVPTPAAGDNDKFLKGDGTWSEDIPRATFVGTSLVFSSGGVFSGSTLLLS